MTDRILGFPQEAFSRRREALEDILADAIMILPAAPLLYRSRDTEHRYRPDSELFYLTGWQDPDAVAVFGVDGEGEESPGSFVFFVPERDPKRELWSGPRSGPQEARERHGADAAFPLAELSARLPAWLSRPREIVFRLGIHPGLDRMVVEALSGARIRGPRKGTGPRCLRDPGTLLDPLRMRKDPWEVEAVRRAAQLTVESFREALAGARPGMGEWEVESLLEAAIRRGGGTGPAFPTVVGAGANACILHYSANQSLIRAGDLVLLDGGAEVGLYAGDVTRTFPVGGSFLGAQRVVYDLVLAAQQAAMEAVGPGNPIARVHEAASEVLFRGLLDLDLLSGDPEALVQERAWEPFFPHQTSHWLGLDVHDVGDYSQGGASTLLEPGMVLTVEPGLYFGSAQEAVPEEFRGIGIRIEDDLLVTTEGAENLTAALPTDPGELMELAGRTPVP